MNEYYLLLEGVRIQHYFSFSPPPPPSPSLLSPPPASSILIDAKDKLRNLFHLSTKEYKDFCDSNVTQLCKLLLNYLPVWVDN